MSEEVTTTQTDKLTEPEIASLQKIKAKRDIDTVYCISHDGLDIYLGNDAQDLVDQVEAPDTDRSYYRFFDAERQKWLYISVKDGQAAMEPLTFPSPEKYGTTSSELYAKAVTYPTVLAQCIELITKTAPTLWERIMKPTTIITAIVVVIFILFVMAVGMTG